MNKKRTIVGLGVSTVAAVAGLLVTGGAASASDPSVQWYDTDGDLIGDQVEVDNWGDGTPDVIGFDADQNGWIEGAIGDLDNDFYFELTMVDVSGNGVLDRFAFDTDLNGYWDVYVDDVNEDGEPDSLPNGQSSPITAQMQIEALNTSILLDMMVDNM